MLLPKPLRLWVIRHKEGGFLTGRGDMGEWSGVFSQQALAVTELAEYDDPEKWEIVELLETGGAS